MSSCGVCLVQVGLVLAWLTKARLLTSKHIDMIWAVTEQVRHHLSSTTVSVCHLVIQLHPWQRSKECCVGILHCTALSLYSEHSPYHTPTVCLITPTSACHLLLPAPSPIACLPPAS